MHGRAMTRATGPFEVKLAPLTTHAGQEHATLARMSIDKEFQGDLAASSIGEMLSAMGSVRGSAGYVAIERVSGSLHGKKGRFVLQHNGTMTRGAPSLTVHVVPDSGTDELEGLVGSMQIVIEGKAHSYIFDYTLG